MVTTLSLAVSSSQVMPVWILPHSTCVSYHGTASTRLEQLVDQAARRYDLVFVCDTDIPYDDTWDRSGNANRQVMQQRILSDLHMRKIPYFLLRGDVEMRVATVQSLLVRYCKYQNLLNLCM